MTVLSRSGPRKYQAHRRCRLGSGLITVAAAVLLTLAGGPAASAQVVQAAAAEPSVTMPGGYGAVTPLRLLDTRYGTGAPQSAVPAGGSLSVPVLGDGGVPASGVSAVVLNVTVTSPTEAGWINAYASGTARPWASNVNFVAGQTVPNLVVAPVGSDGKVTLYNGSAGTVQLIADISGYYMGGTVPAGGFGSVAPLRLLDLRNGTGAPQGELAAGGTTTFTVLGTGGVPATGISSVVLNVTATEPTAGGFITAYASGTPRPLSSNLNFLTGQTVPNLAMVPVGADGKISLYNGSAGSVSLIADISGYYVAGAVPSGGFGSVAPLRLLDTRYGTGAPKAAVPAEDTVSVEVAGHGGVPESGVSAVVLNVTATAPKAAGFSTVYASGTPRPLASNLNFATGQTVPNLVIAPVGLDGKVTLYNGSAGSVELLADVFGYFLEPATSQPPGQGMASITFDDGTLGQYTYGRSILQTRNLHATFYLISDALDWTATNVNVEKVRDLMADGHEVGNHTKDHADLALLTPAQVETEFAESQAVIANKLGVTPTSCAYPNGSHNATVDQIAARHFKACRGVEGGLNTAADASHFNVLTYYVTSTTKPEDITAAAQAAKDSNSWVVFVYHVIDGGTPDPGIVTPTNLAAQMDALVASGITVRTVGEALTNLGW